MRSYLLVVLLIFFIGCVSQDNQKSIPSSTTQYNFSASMYTTLSKISTTTISTATTQMASTSSTINSQVINATPNFDWGKLGAHSWHDTYYVYFELRDLSGIDFKNNLTISERLDIYQLRKKCAENISKSFMADAKKAGASVDIAIDNKILLISGNKETLNKIVFNPYVKAVYASNPGIADKPFSNLELKSCEKNEECMRVSESVCDCGSMGRAITINKKFSSYWDDKISVDGIDRACLASMSQDISCYSDTVCKYNMCLLEPNLDRLCTGLPYMNCENAKPTAEKGQDNMFGVQCGYISYLCQGRNLTVPK